MMVVSAVRAAHIDIWSLEYPFRECLNLFSQNFEIVHVYRQKNHVANRLVVVAHQHKTRLDYFRVEELPREAHRAFVADSLGFWGFRR